MTYSIDRKKLQKAVYPRLSKKAFDDFMEWLDA